MAEAGTGKNSQQAWNDYFQAGWEANNGREQSRLFAQYLVDAVTFPSDAKTLLDVGCALGDGTVVFKQKYPNLSVTGCDFSEVAIDRARQRYGDSINFEKWSFDQVKDHYDVIVSSNTLEHFANYLEIAGLLLRHTNYLCIMVPYYELSEGKQLQPNESDWHQATFTRKSFDGLKLTGRNVRISTKVIYTPGAWGHRPSWLGRVYLALRPNAGWNCQQVIYIITTDASK
jgi:SAM-dependent methyltransferase